MDKAIWKGREIYITDIVNNGELEPLIDEASRNHELLCPDPACDTKILQYCHGNIYTAYFRHLNAGNCDYINYNKSDTAQIRKIRRKLYEHFSKQYDIRIEEKIIEHHFTPLIITMPDNTLLAIDFITKNNLENAEYLLNQYNKLQIPVNLIDINHIPNVSNAKQLSKAKRFIISQSEKKSIIAIDPEELAVRQYKIDTTEYDYNNSYIPENNIFQSDILSTNDLIIIDNNLCIKNFDNSFKQWQNRKQQENKSINLTGSIDKSDKKTLNHNLSDYSDYRDKIVQELINSIKRNKKKHPNKDFYIDTVCPNEEEWFGFFSSVYKKK